MRKSKQPKEKMITRTCTQSTIEVYTVNIKTCEVLIETHILGGKWENNENTLAHLRGIFETEELKLVSINSIEETELLLGMTESVFIRYANVIPTSK